MKSNHEMEIVVPSVNRLRPLFVAEQCYAIGSLGYERELKMPTGKGLALYRLIARFGLPNSPRFHRWNREALEGRGMKTWEYIFRVNRRSYFAVYDWRGVVTVGWRAPIKNFKYPSMNMSAAREDLYKRFCRFIEDIINGVSK